MVRRPHKIVLHDAARAARADLSCAFPLSHPKGDLAVVYGELDTSRFLAAVQRLKRQQHRRERLTRLAKQRVRAALRKIREC